VIYHVRGAFYNGYRLVRLFGLPGFLSRYRRLGTTGVEISYVTKPQLRRFTKLARCMKQYSVSIFRARFLMRKTLGGYAIMQEVLSALAPI